jgi:hypothetical protein
MAIKIVEREVIKDDAITAAKVEDGTVVAADLTTNFITNAHVKSDAAIAASKITGLATSATTDTTNASNIASGTLPTARLDTGTTANKIVILDGNAKLPAISGASLTGIESATVSTSDPVITTNPSGGVGTKWINKTSGEVYICTDATAGENVWTNVGAGSDNISPFYFTSTDTYGFCGMGYGESPTGNWPRIDRIAFASDTISDQGDTTQSRRGCASSSSTSHTYVAAGYTGSYVNTIDKFAMASPANSTDVGDLGRTTDKGGSGTSEGYGYKFGSGTNAAATYIYRWSHTTDGNSTDWASLNPALGGSMGGSSQTHGYALGSRNYTGVPAAAQEGIHKIAWASGGSSSDIGNLTHSGGPVAAQSTDGYIYATGRNTTGTAAENKSIQKFSTVSDGNAVARGGALYRERKAQGGGFSSKTYGYTGGGGQLSPNIYTNIIDKFAFATTADSTDVGDLADARGEQPCQGQY